MRNFENTVVRRSRAELEERPDFSGLFCLVGGNGNEPLASTVCSRKLRPSYSPPWLTFIMLFCIIGYIISAE